jgi:quercetin dioxygenase-like cupin family protein
MTNEFLRHVVLCGLAAAISWGAAAAFAQAESGSVERSGISAELKRENLVTGNLSELNGKYKLRVASVTYEVGGFIGNHHHAGPGLRCVFEGQLTYVQEGVSNVFGPGDCFYEPGDVDHHAQNKGQVPVRLFNFQILPESWEGSSAITVTPAP